MADQTGLKRYDLFGWDYELIQDLPEVEVAWYRVWAGRSGRTGRTVLELACGTGRLACRLAEAGFETVGLDLSETMLGIARRNASGLPEDALGSLSIVKGDMGSFDLGRRFDLIIVADNSFRLAGTREALEASLKCMRRHCADGGRVLISERRFESKQFTDGRRSFGWSEPRPDPRTGHSVSRRGEVRLSKDGKRMSGAFVYRTTRPDGTVTEDRIPFAAPILEMEEYLELFGREGFSAAAYADYHEVESFGAEKTTCFVLTPTP